MVLGFKMVQKGLVHDTGVSWGLGVAQPYLLCVFSSHFHNRDTVMDSNYQYHYQVMENFESGF